MDKNIAEKAANILLDIHAVSFNPNQPYKYASGILSPVYTDCRLLISHPKERKQILSYLAEKVNNMAKKPDVISGTATAGIPHAAWLADILDLPMIYVRGSAKDHGKHNQIEGELKQWQQALIIEDLISTGGSSCNNAIAIRQAGGQVSEVLAIMTYNMQSAQDNFKKNNLSYSVLTNLSTIVKVAEQKNYLKDDERQIVFNWANNPAEWSKNRS